MASPTGRLPSVRPLRHLFSRLLLFVDERVFPPSVAGGSDHWVRYVMDRVVSDYIASLRPENLSALEISGTSHQQDGWMKYESWNYPDFDICSELAGDEPEFEVVLAEQVLEHVIDPVRALRNMVELCRPSGYVIVTTPFLIKKHEIPKDYWRFTEDGMRALLERAGLIEEVVGSWGNRYVVVGNFNRWARRMRWHTLRNEPNFPVVVWAVGRKPPTIIG